MNSIKNYILQQVATQAITQDQAKQFLLELNQAQAAITSNEAQASSDGTTASTAASVTASSKASRDNAVAIIGMSGRFPKAENVAEFWGLLRDGVNCIDDFPEVRQKDFEHILRNPYYTEFLIGDAVAEHDIHRAHAKAGYMKHIDKFDAAFFGIPPSEATHMDPNQRQVLECAWEAIENAGYGGETLYGQNVGVYIGKENTNYSLYRYCAEKDPMQLTGTWESIMASRISYLFNFRGPCMVVDTACSAGLVSVHMGAAAVLCGDCDVAIAGGINLSIVGELNTEFQGGMTMDSVESSDGKIRTFDAKANGTVWGEGVALVLVKPLQKALDAGDVIHAVIKGSAINNDGASNGLTAPNADAQEEVIVKAWENAGINPESLSYIEAHGTGTVLGDPIEFKGLTSAFRRYTQKKQFCAIGSLKTNMGHLVAASGCASLFKVISQMQHQQLAPTINFSEPNPYIAFQTSPLYVNDQLSHWHSDGPRRAAISSFGFSHTNCHMVIEEAPDREAVTAKHSAYVLTISAKKPELLANYLDLYLDFSVDWNLDMDQAESTHIADLCFTANIGRGHYDSRVAIVLPLSPQFSEQSQELSQELARKLTLAKQLLANELEPEQAQQQMHAEQVYYNSHSIVSEKKTQREPGEITDKEKKQLSENAAAALENSLSANSAGASNSTAYLSELAQHYVAGADINWSAFYQGETRQKLAIPTYPFEQVRLWAAPKITKIADFSSRLHPLVERLAGQTDTSWTFESVFSEDKHWVLADHKIKHTCVVPGTTYLEMARFAASQATNLSAMELQNIFFLQPMVVEENEQRLVRIVVTKAASKDADVASFIIESCALNANANANTSASADDNKQEWQQHVEGRAVALDKSRLVENEQATGALDLNQLQSQLPDFEEYSNPETDTGVFQFGPHWNSVRSAWTHNDRFDRDALAKMSLPVEFQSELADFHIHPSVLDNAMNLTSQNSGHTFLPFMYKSFRFYRPFTNVMYSYINPGEISDETHNYNVVLTDEQGVPLAEITGYVTKKVHSFNFSGEAKNEYLALRWTPPASDVATAPIAGEQALPQHVSVFAQTINSELQQAFAQLGVQASFHELATLTPEHASELAQGELQTANAIAIVMNQSTDFASLSNEQSAAIHTGSNEALFNLIKANAEHKVKLSDGLLVLSHSAHTNEPHASASNPWAASVNYLAITAAQEDADLTVRSLEVSETALSSTVLTQLFTLPTGKRFAWRNGQLLQAELYPTEQFTADEQSGEPAIPAFTPQPGVYIITGGLGGLGLATADYLAQQAQQSPQQSPDQPYHVILTGRSELPDNDQWQTLANAGEKRSSTAAKLLDLQQRLASVRYVQTDMASADSVSQLIHHTQSWAQKENTAIRGVFHTAGIAGDGFILRKSLDTFQAVLSAKVNGTVFLLNALRDSKVSPDFVLMYSSTTAITAGEGQSDYAAANAFMDALCEMNKLGETNSSTHLCSINWPSWAEVGMAADFGIGDDNSPFSVIAPDVAFAKMAAILAHQMKGNTSATSQAHSASANISGAVIPGDINPAVLADELHHLPVALTPELETLLKRAASAANSDASIDDVEVDIRGKSEDDLTETEITLAKVYAAVLGLAEIDIFTNFQDMGGNSIIATHLLKVIEEFFPGLVDISDVFSYPAIDVMAEYIDDKRGVAPQDASESANEESAEEKDGEKDWDNMLDSVVDGEGSIDDLLDSF